MDKVIIYLGSKCNMKCRYCHRESSEIEMGVSDKLLAFLKDRRCTITFKGGEPTLYMDDIKKVVSIANKAIFEISTNGIFLEKYIEYFRKHKFKIFISYDGDNSKLRGFDPFTKILDYPWIGVSSTLYHGNTDLNNILDNFAEKSLIVGRPLGFYPHLVHYTNSQNRDYALTDEDYQSILEQFKECIYKYFDDLSKYGTINLRYRGLYLSLRTGLDNQYNFGETACANKDTQRIDTTGKRYNCLYIRDTLLSDDNWFELQQDIIRSMSPECEKCAVYDMCGSGCIKSLHHDKECWFYKELYTWFKDFYFQNKDILERMECDGAATK